MAVNVYFVRHGQTYFNLFHKYQGWSDAPLTDKGIADGKRVGKALADLRIDYLFSSDLRRTVKTAELLAANHPTTIKHPTTDPAFREIFFGYFEGENEETASLIIGRCKSFHDLVQTYTVEKTRDMIAAADPFKLAEDNQTFWERVDKGLDRLRALPDNSNVVVVSHGATIRSIVSRYAADKTLANESPVNGSITKLSLTPEQTKIDFYNQLTLPKNL